MRRIVLLAVPIALAGCGGSQTRENHLRPPTPVTLTAAIHEDAVQVSPARVGAGIVVLVVSNQSSSPQTVTFETNELGGARGGTTASSPEIAPRSTGRLTIHTRQGLYSVHTQDDAIRAAAVKIGPPRKSSQDDLLLP
ncbi:hypothetical protein OM076_15930 [Solirubrobacter ginsenosidimutans]|uniref:Lipoprotein n=1 Tax=Solirubrobacter ginsenosidimutans TaxID=490573 RepID=A0A9X3MUZ1_9ACTN|nr:hypothetical protein [Solirubrobacter ginsenosidimutans]MDA0161763.1 hypothetical protein [Solirubrobacter ginsenosidimutans]